MKKTFIFLSIVALALVSCAKSPEEKAEALIKDSILKSLYLPDTYEAVETKVDSAYSPYQDPSFVTLILDLAEKTEEYDDLYKDMKLAQSRMAIWSYPNGAFSKDQYNNYKEEYDNYAQKAETLMDKIQNEVQTAREAMSKQPEFIGYSVIHTYRAQNNAGATLIDYVHFIVDKDIENILGGFTNEQVQTYNNYLQEIIDAGNRQNNGLSQ